MRILVTGGTGFVGSHMTAGLIRGGHDVRLFVRTPEKVAATFAALNVTAPSDVVAGDITDLTSIRAAMEGCDAVLHAASIYSLDPRKGSETGRTNVAGMRNVLDAALASGLDPIVHVSSYGVLLPAKGGIVTADSEPSTGLGPYTRSKAEQERIARQHQAEGKPVVTVMPGGVWGPGDPYIGESYQIASSMLKGMMPMLPRVGSFPIVDVRDMADPTARIFEPGRGPRRYLMAGTLTETTGVSDLLAEVTGRRIRYVRVPTFMARQSSVAAGALQRISPWRLPLEPEAAQIGTQPLVSVDDSRAEQELGFTKRPLAETFSDTVRALLEKEVISAKQAGLIASKSAEPVSG